MSAPRIAEFRGRLLAGDLLVGTFLKTPSVAIMEILAMAGLDCVCIDTEHAPFDRAALEAVVLAARAHGMPSLVRLRSATPTECLNALDLGATGVIVPHITSAALARAAALACRYQADGRGYAGSTRSAGYSTVALPEVIARANAETCVIAQIEDASALTEIDEILAAPGIDAIFIGRMDLTVSLGASSADAPQVVQTVHAISEASRRVGRTLGMFTATVEEAHRWRAGGASFFLLGSDQQWVLHGARALRAAFQSPGAGT